MTATAKAAPIGRKKNKKPEKKRKKKERDEDILDSDDVNMERRKKHKNRMAEMDKDSDSSVAEAAEAVQSAPKIEGRRYPYDVFISHAWKDESTPTSKVVKELFEVNHFLVWYDETNVAGDMIKAMATGIDESAIFLLVSSEGYQNSEYCMKEVKYANRIGKKIIHISTGFQTTGDLDFLIGSLFYYEIPRDKKKLLSKIKQDVEEAQKTIEF